MSSEYTTSIQCTTNSNICATVLQCDSSILQGAITISVLPKGYYSYKLQFILHTVISRVIFNHKDYHYSYKLQFILHTVISRVIFNHKDYHTVTTIRVNHSCNHGSIIRVLSSVNSSVALTDLY